MFRLPVFVFDDDVLFFFFNDTATTEIYTLSLHDALPICSTAAAWATPTGWPWNRRLIRSEEHTSELQSPCNLVCRLLLEKKKHGRIDQTDRLIGASSLSSGHYTDWELKDPQTTSIGGLRLMSQTCSRQ